MKQPSKFFVLDADGAAFDGPNTHRAFTYRHQPGNVDASKLGRATDAASQASAGDSIDRGLALLQELQAAGFGVFQISTHPAAPGKGDSVEQTHNDDELPGMWSHSDFTGGDPDERSYAERARAAAASTADGAVVEHAERWMRLLRDATGQEHEVAMLDAILAALARPNAAPEVSEAMVAAALDAQPFGDSGNIGTRVWQFFGLQQADAETVMRAALTAALSARTNARDEKGESNDG